MQSRQLPRVTLPVNPIVWQWDSANSFVDLATFPYFNKDGEVEGTRPGVGDYDD